MAHKLHLRTSGRFYWFADGGGGGAITGKGVWPREWETFEVVPIGMTDPTAPLRHGQEVRLRTHAGHYVVAGTGDAVLAAPATTPPGPEGTFVLAMAPGEGDTLEHLRRVGLRTPAGHWVCAENGGNDVLRANRTAMAEWETFVADFEPEPRGFVRWLALRSTSGRSFLRAERGGGGELSTTGPSVGQDEAFDLVAADRDARDFGDGARVHLRTSNGYFVQAVNGGGTDVTAVGPWPREWETFTLTLAVGEPAHLAYGSRFGLRTDRGFYVRAVGPTSKVQAPRTQMGPEETFVFSRDLEAGQDTFVLLTGSVAGREDRTSSTSYAPLVGPGRQFELYRQRATIQVLFVVDLRSGTSGSAVDVRFVVDGQEAKPGALRVSPSTMWAPVTFTGWLDVSRGMHTVDAEWRYVPSDLGPGGEVTAGKRTLTVLTPN
jgi:hypothetical protein